VRDLVNGGAFRLDQFGPLFRRFRDEFFRQPLGLPSALYSTPIALFYGGVI
jgi:hypothetical protein